MWQTSLFEHMLKTQVLVKLALSVGKSIYAKHYQSWIQTSKPLSTKLETDELNSVAALTHVSRIEW